MSAYKIEKSALYTFIGICFLFSFAVIVTLFSPMYVDKSWIQPTSSFQVQMYEVSDPNLYISRLNSESTELQGVYHLKKDYTLLAFQESEAVRIIAPQELQKYVTGMDGKTLKLTSRLLMLRKPEGDAKQKAAAKITELQAMWKKENPGFEKSHTEPPFYDIRELYEPPGTEAFAVAPVDRILEDWVDRDFEILDEKTAQEYHKEPGVVYVKNPVEYRVTYHAFGGEGTWAYDPDKGKPVKNIEELKSLPLGFRSRQELIKYGEHTYAIEGCWYCHTDQSRTLIQDSVLNGSDSYPAPPSSANEYIYQRITFPGTRRIGPDISRVGVKRPARDWHQSHFWEPSNVSKGSIMPSFKHFFDYDPRGTSKATTGIPNYRFEAVYQYLITKGTRITPPTEAWWLGEDPVQTIKIIEGMRQ